MTTATNADHMRYITALANQLMHNHAPAGWSWAWDSARKRGGLCKYGPGGGPGKITLSKALFAVWSVDACRQTILHEIAHARAGSGAGHGPKWAAQCRELGIKPERCWKPSETQPMLPERPRPVIVGTCPTGHTVIRHRMPGKGVRASCARCSPYAFNAAYELTWEKRSK